MSNSFVLLQPHFSPLFTGCFGFGHVSPPFPITNSVFCLLLHPHFSILKPVFMLILPSEPSSLLFVYPKFILRSTHSTKPPSVIPIHTNIPVLSHLLIGASHTYTVFLVGLVVIKLTHQLDWLVLQKRSCPKTWSLVLTAQTHDLDSVCTLLSPFPKCFFPHSFSRGFWVGPRVELWPGWSGIV